jgi:MFS family permease
VGPNLAAPGGRLGEALGLPALGGVFVVSAGVLAVVAVGFLVLLRPDPLVLARRLGGRSDGPRPRRATRPALRAVWAAPHGPLGLVAVVVAHSVMVGVMVMTPVHMGHAGGPEDAVLRLVGLVISVHVAGMYLFSPLVGMLVDRVGAPVVVAVGGLLLLLAAGIAGTAAPADHVQLSAGLLLLGLGWSCGLVAGSALVTASVDADVRATAQGGTDLLMGLGAALAGVIGGPLLAVGGFGLVSAVSAALVLPLALVWATTAGAQRPR